MNDKTMTFSLGNEQEREIHEIMFQVYNALKEKGYNPLAYRLFTLQSHYRKQLIFSFESLDSFQNAYNKLLNTCLNRHN